jgi:hypothetical protein
MARIRTIKPEFFTSEDIVALTPLARLLYVALWCEADKEGRMVWKPKTFKMRYMPADQVVIEDLCDELLKTGLVVLYGNGFAYVPQFKRHQHLNPRETDSVLPDPDASSTRAPRVKHATVTLETRDSDAQGGREGKGKERNTPQTPQGGSPGSPGFLRFWSAWPKHPRKEAKGKCLEAWLKAGAELQADLIVEHVEALKRSPGWTKEGGQFIPAPLVYLRNRRWEGSAADATDHSATNGSPEWWQEAGFRNRWEAENDGCYPHTAHLFHDGQRRGPAS